MAAEGLGEAAAEAERVGGEPGARLTWGGMAGEFEKLAYQAALRRLDKQERLVEELRARTGVLLAASSLAASVLGQQAFRYPHPRPLVIAALAGFVASIGIAALVLMPQASLQFAESPANFQEDLFEVREEIAEVYRELTLGLDRFWRSNDLVIATMARGYRLASVALMVEVVFLSALASRGFA